MASSGTTLNPPTQRLTPGDLGPHPSTRTDEAGPSLGGRKGAILLVVQVVLAIAFWLHMTFHQALCSFGRPAWPAGLAWRALGLRIDQ